MSNDLLDKLLTPELWTSVFSMLIGLSSLVGSVILSARAQEDKCGHKVAVRLCIMAGITVALTLSYWLLVAKGFSLNAFLLLFSMGCLLLGGILSFINIPISTTLMRIVEKDKLSKVTSILSILSQGLVPIAAVLAGAALQCFGSTFLLLVCSIGFTAAALFLLFNRQAKEI